MPLSVIYRRLLGCDSSCATTEDTEEFLSIVGSLFHSDLRLMALLSSFIERTEHGYLYSVSSVSISSVFSVLKNFGAQMLLSNELPFNVRLLEQTLFIAHCSLFIDHGQFRCFRRNLKVPSWRIE